MARWRRSTTSIARLWGSRQHGFIGSCRERLWSSARYLRSKALAALIDVYRFDEFARDLATAIPDEEGASAVIGLGDEGQRELYDLLPAFIPDGVTAASCSKLATTPSCGQVRGSSSLHAANCQAVS